MKHVIIEAGDRLGKDTLIKGLVEHYKDNITIRHFGKPPSYQNLQNVNILNLQFYCFTMESKIIKTLKEYENNSIYRYFENMLIWNRSHLGEYVYGQMFRKFNKNEIKKRILRWERSNIINNKIDTYLINLYSTPQFFFSKEDGNSFSTTLKQKEIELDLFHEAYEFSLINNKLRINVEKDNQFLPKENILTQVINFIDKNK